MDIIPNKVTLDFHFLLDSDKEIEKELIITRNFKLLADIEGELEIDVDNRSFFSEKYFLLLEFGIELSKWLNKIKSDDVVDFSYETVSFNEGPILEFIQSSEDSWRILSQWQKFECNYKIPQDVLMSSVEKLLAELESHFIKLYSLSMNDFL